MSPTISRTIPGLIEALRVQLRLLETYSAHLMQGQNDFLGEVATKVRLLAIRLPNRNHKPLLSELMLKTGIEIRIPNNGPPVRRPDGSTRPESWTLEELMGELACAYKLSTGELAEISHADLVRSAAEKFGGAHEDWEISETVIRALRSRVFAGDMQIGAAQVLNVARTVLRVGKQFFAEYERRQLTAPPGKAAEIETALQSKTPKANVPTDSGDP